MDDQGDRLVKVLSGELPIDFFTLDISESSGRDEVELPLPRESMVNTTSSSRQTTASACAKEEDGEESDEMQLSEPIAVGAIAGIEEEQSASTASAISTPPREDGNIRSLLCWDEVRDLWKILTKLKAEVGKDAYLQDIFEKGAEAAKESWAFDYKMVSENFGDEVRPSFSNRKVAFGARPSRMR